MPQIQYRFSMGSGLRFDFEVELDRPFDPAANPHGHAEWTRLDCHQCGNCPLKCETCKCCPVAIDIESVSSQFADILSYEGAHIEVTTQERTYSKDTDAQTGLRSLLGLIMATSACPVLSQLRGLASSHLPFANLEETLFRTTGAYLIKQYFIYKDGGVPDLDLTGLDTLYRELQTVNRCFKGRLDTAFAKDSNLNAIGSLLYVAVGVSYSLEDNLMELKTLFHRKS